MVTYRWVAALLAACLLLALALRLEPQRVDIMGSEAASRVYLPPVSYSQQQQQQGVCVSSVQVSSTGSTSVPCAATSTNAITYGRGVGQ